MRGRDVSAWASCHWQRSLSTGRGSIGKNAKLKSGQQSTSKLTSNWSLPCGWLNDPTPVRRQASAPSISCCWGITGWRLGSWEEKAERGLVKTKQHHWQFVTKSVTEFILITWILQEAFPSFFTTVEGWQRSSVSGGLSLNTENNTLTCRSWTPTTKH